MRNFIHINLCISLGISQLIFVAGIDRTSGIDDQIPLHCKAIAVLLHYFFLVSFMWMLMEGVILYLALVVIFVEPKKRYYVAFMVVSYGIPLLYLAAVTLPLGFALPTQPNYGYGTA
jgi:latrophilin 2